MLAAACGSSSSSGSSSASSGKTYTVGILTDATGPGPSGNKTGVQGVQAGTVLAHRDGYTIKCWTVRGDGVSGAARGSDPWGTPRAPVPLVGTKPAPEPSGGY